MAVTDIVGAERIAYKEKKLPITKLEAGKGVVPGSKKKEVKETPLKSGRGVVP